MYMHTTPSDFERLQGVLRDAEEPLTAREILSELEERGENPFESTHQIATVLGRRARDGDVAVISQQPYEYQLAEN